MDLFLDRHKEKRVEDRDQSNFEFLLSMGDKELEAWLADLPEDYLTYVEWLLEKVEYQLDKLMIISSDYSESSEVIRKIKDGISNS